MKGLGNLGQIMKLQREFKSVQKKLQKNEIEGQSPDGSVMAKVNGEYKLVEIQINEDIITPSNKKKLEKMIVSAVNDAVDKAKEYAAGEVSRLTGGLNIAGINDLLNK